jgi:hypothetical protein
MGRGVLTAAMAGEGPRITPVSKTGHFPYGRLFNRTVILSGLRTGTPLRQVIQCFDGNMSDELRMFPQSCLKLSQDVFRLGFIGCYGFRAKLPDPLIVDTMRFHYETTVV